MKLIEKLSEDVAADHREKKKSKLQRTFVGAKDAAEAKVKRKNLSFQKTSLKDEFQIYQ